MKSATSTTSWTGEQDVTGRELSRLAGEVAAIESMLQRAQSGRDEG